MADLGDLAAWWEYLVPEQRDELRVCAEQALYLPSWAVVSLSQPGYIDPMEWVLFVNGEGGYRLPEPVVDHITQLT
jgi:hypothetical protein